MIVPLKLLMLVTLQLYPAMAKNVNKVNLIRDYVRLQNKPTRLVVWKNCFENDDMMSLMRNSSTSTMFHRKDTLNASDFGFDIQYWLFVVDLTCNEPIAIIEKVFRSFLMHLKILDVHDVHILAFSKFRTLLRLFQIDKRLLAHPYRWLMFLNNDEALREILALPDSDILIAKSTEKGVFALKQFYKVEPSSTEIHYEHFGEWNPVNGLIDERKVKIISRRRRNLHGKLMTVSYVHLNKASRNHLADFVDKQTDGLLKTNYIILNAVLDQLNVTRKEIFQSTWGYYNPKTRKWSGMIDDMINNGADIGGFII